MNFSLIAERLILIKIRVRELGQVFAEIYKGFVRRDELFYRATLAFAWIGFFITIEWDVWPFKRFGLWHFYPADGIIFRLYVPLVTLSPFLLYGIRIRAHKLRFAKDLKEVFELVGLKNALGRYPQFLSLEPITGGTMKLRLTNGAFPIAEWTKRKEKLEANMRVFIDDIRTVQERGVIEIIFSFEPMPNKVKIDDIFVYRNYTYLLGRGRTTAYIGDFSKSPHLLVGGETGAGKSWFFRQLITTIKLNQPEAEFHMMDSKNGTEFGNLSKYPGITVNVDIGSFAAELLTVKGLIQERAEALKARGLTKIDEYFATNEYRGMGGEQRASHVLGRRVFVVADECAEIFLFGLGHDPKFTREIRAAMSQITRLGRFVGIHAILGTQRPDKQAVDPQVKTNLTTTVCYRIHDLGGSLAVLGTGRAADLPKIPGRAILAEGSEEREIQTPLLEIRDSTNLLDEKFGLSPTVICQEEKDASQEAPQSTPF